MIPSLPENGKTFGDYFSEVREESLGKQISRISRENLVNHRNPFNGRKLNALLEVNRLERKISMRRLTERELPVATIGRYLFALLNFLCDISLFFYYRRGYPCFPSFRFLILEGVTRW